MDMFNLSSEDSLSDTTQSISEKSIAETVEDHNVYQLSKWSLEKRFLVCLLDHIKTYEKEIGFNCHNNHIKVDGCDNTDRIDMFKSTIKEKGFFYMINDWNYGKDNREKVINLISLLSEGKGSIQLGNDGAYEVLKSAITANCWEQMEKSVAVAETIPNIEIWEAPILAILSKFPYYESSELNIIVKHYEAIDWTKGDSFSLKMHISPLRGNILKDFMIPEDKKLEDFFLVMRKRTYSIKETSSQNSQYSQYRELRDLLYLNLTNSIFINDDQWNSHIRTFVSNNKAESYARKSGFNIF